MNSTSKTLLSALIISLFSLATLQGYRVIIQDSSPTQVLGETTVKSVPCDIINSWQKQYCPITDNTVTDFLVPTCTPRPKCLDTTPACKMPENPNWCKTDLYPTHTPENTPFPANRIILPNSDLY